MGYLPDGCSHKRRKTGGGAIDYSNVIASGNHRLHYRWNQLKLDGASKCPLPSPDRIVQMDPTCEYASKPLLYPENYGLVELPTSCDIEVALSSVDYNTFSKNGALKLTEIEVFFLSSRVTLRSVHEWVVIYLGIGNGERFRYLRDTFFPGLQVVAFDPLCEYENFNAVGLKNAAAWKNDGTGFNFQVRGFDFQADPAWIQEIAKEKKMLLISDIRGARPHSDADWNTSYDQDLQLQVIEALSPVSSLVKFNVPDSDDQFFEYAPGTVLKQVFSNYGSIEVRLMIDGAPRHRVRYNAWELQEKMKLHHDSERGIVYELSRDPTFAQCFDQCFDCTVLWNTLVEYTATNGGNPYELLSNLVKHQVYIPTNCLDIHGGWENYVWQAPSVSQRWWDVAFHLENGKVMEAIAALEVEGREDWEGTDWVDIADCISHRQPSLAERMKRDDTCRPLSRKGLSSLLGSLAEPPVVVRTYHNGLLKPPWEKET